MLSLFLKASINVEFVMVAAPTFACLTPLVSLVPAPLASSWREMSRHVTLLQRPTCFSLAVLPSVESHWTPVTTQMCTYLSLSWTMSFLWTMIVWMARFTTQMYFLMLSGRCQSTARLLPNSVTCAECASKLGRTKHYHYLQLVFGTQHHVYQWTHAASVFNLPETGGGGKY